VSDGPPSRPDTPRGIEPRLRQGPDGPVWRFRVRWRDPRSGRRLVEELDTIDDALDFQAHLRLARRRGVLSELDRGTTRLDAFVERWWATWAAHNLTRPTLRVYAAVWNLHGLPRVGALPLREITPATIDELGAALEADGVGPSAIRKLMTMLQSVFRQAVTWGEASSNPPREVKKPPARRALVVVALAAPRRRGAARRARPGRRHAREPARLRGPAPGGRARAVRRARPPLHAADRGQERRGRDHRRLEDRPAPAYPDPVRPCQGRPRRAPARARPPRRLHAAVRPRGREAVARDRLPQLAPAAFQARRRAARAADHPPLRPAPRLREPAAARRLAADRGRRAPRPLCRRAVRHLRARDRRAARPAPGAGRDRDRARPPQAPAPERPQPARGRRRVPSFGHEKGPE
jgi:hypothetical protein